MLPASKDRMSSSYSFSPAAPAGYFPRSGQAARSAVPAGASPTEASAPCDPLVRRCIVSKAPEPEPEPEAAAEPEAEGGEGDGAEAVAEEAEGTA